VIFFSYRAFTFIGYFSLSGMLELLEIANKTWVIIKFAVRNMLDNGTYKLF